jgi:outer membrane protein OmpA-like peptidoglycan-associated protein
MMNFKKLCLMATVGAMLAPAAVFAGEYQDVVRDARSNVVVNSFEHCVLTKWTTNKDECMYKSYSRDVRKLSRDQRTVYFDFNKSTINSKEKAKLDDLSSIIVAAKEVESVDIVGYADMIGKSSYNKALSTRRAQAVKSYLSSKGLKTRKTRVEGLGEAQSVTKCDNKMPRAELIACLAEDRRVEIELNFTK